MEYVEDEFCNKTVTDVVNCTIEYSKHQMNSTDLKPEAVAVPLTFALIFVIGVTGNVLLILNFARHKNLSTPHNALVVNLAAGDLLMLMIGVPFNSVWYTLPDWPFGDFLCRLSRFAETLATAVTICTLTVLSVERFFIVTGRRRHQPLHSLPVLVLLFVWLLGLLIAVPDFLSPTLLTPHNLSSQHQYCVDFNPEWGAVYPKVNVMSKFVLLFFLPLLVIAPCYVGLAFHLLFKMFGARATPTSKTPLTATSQAPRDDSGDVKEGPTDEAGQNDVGGLTRANPSGQGRMKKARKRRRLAVTVLGLVLCFLLCWLPRYVYLLWFYFDPGLFNAFWHVFKMAGFFLMFSNSAVNPFVFYVLDLRFRAFVHAAVLCRNESRQGEGQGEGGGGRGGRGDTCLVNVETTAVEMSVTEERKNYIALAPLPDSTQTVDAV